MSERLEIDINCDMGESLDPAHDAALMPYITSCNVACGGHAGDPATIEETVRRAIVQGVGVGAHPSYPDQVGFGRRKMEFEPAELKAVIKDQILAVKSIVERLGGQLAHVKPHGALYNACADSKSESLILLEAMVDVQPGLKSVGFAGGATEPVAAGLGVLFIPEAFADRRYTPDGRLVSRCESGAVIDDPHEAVEQVLSIVCEQCVGAGARITVSAKTICVHGDNLASRAILEAMDVAFAQHGISRACL